MAFTIKDARGVCTASELELVKLSRSSAAKQETPGRLRQKIARTRKLRDKFRDESARQAREARGKAAPRGTRASEGNERTVLKAEIFQDVLDRFEAMLSAQEAKAEKAAAGAGTAKSGKKKTSGKAAAESTSAKAAGKTVKKSTKKKTAKKSAAKDEAPKSGAKTAGKSSSKTGGKMTAKKTGKSAGLMTGSASLAGVPRGGAAAFSGSLPAAESRSTRRRAHHNESVGSRVESQFAATNQTRLKGHVSAKGKRSQARRDSK